jgi:tRNA nucleotidyltransferase (CCA-adding enzyme)
MVRIYEVGGSIRDRLLYGPDHTSKDIDYAVEASSFEEMLLYVREELGYKVFLEKEEFGSIRAKNKRGEVCDYTIARKDGIYKDGRHPESIEICSIEEDLARRDATCNAIARCVETGKIIDPFGGVADIENSLIKAVGKPADRCKEDGLRTLRYLRLHVTKGMKISVPLLDHIWDCHMYLSGVSTDRIRDELTRMFKFDTYITIRAMDEYLSGEALSYIVDRGIWLLPSTKER